MDSVEELGIITCCLFRCLYTMALRPKPVMYETHSYVQYARCLYELAHLPLLQTSSSEQSLSLLQEAPWQ